MRYPGKYPRKFAEKYKEHAPERYADTVSKVLASGKTPAGTHRPILLAEILEVLAPQAGQRMVDCTLGYGGHAEALLQRLVPGGSLLALDADPLQLPKTELRLRQLGYDSQSLRTVRSNFAGLPKALAAQEWDGADGILADLGVSSMQLDDPARGFSLKLSGPLDMRMNPGRGLTAAQLLERLSVNDLARLLEENADETHAAHLADALAGRPFRTTTELNAAVRKALSERTLETQELAVRRVFQALRIAVNDEFAALDTFLRALPQCLRGGGRVVILTFHSGEDRRVKKAFEAGRREGAYDLIADELVRPSAEERRQNPRSSSAKLRWARRATEAL